MEPFIKLTTHSDTNQISTDANNKKIYLITSPWDKVRIQQNHKLPEVYQFMETEQLSTEPPLGQGRHGRLTS